MALVTFESVRGYLGPVVFLLVGSVGLGYAGMAWKETDAFLAGAAGATGEVVMMREEDRHIQPRQRGEVEETYRPIVRFRTDTGREVRFESVVSSHPPRYAEGDRVRVLYDPRQPEVARIDDFIDLWLRPVFAAGVGLILALLGAASLHTRIRHGRERMRRGYHGGGR